MKPPRNSRAEYLSGLVQKGPYPGGEGGNSSYTRRTWQPVSGQWWQGLVEHAGCRVDGIDGFIGAKYPGGPGGERL